MPYLNCPTCGISIYSAAAYSTSDECPRGHAILRKAPVLGSEQPYRHLVGEMHDRGASLPGAGGEPRPY